MLSKLDKFSKEYLDNSMTCLILIIFFGTIYGGFIYGFPQESVTFAKTFLGDYNYNKSNLWYLGVLNSPPTFQIYFPYVLLKIGIGENLVNFFIGSLSCSLSFLSLFLITKIITSSNKLSLLPPLFFLFHRFIDTHWYGIYYPVNFFYFGQMGMYLAISSVCFYFLDNKKTSSFFLILNIFCHAAWGFFNLIFIFFLYLKDKEFPSFKFSHFAFFLTLLFVSSITYFEFKEINNIENFNYINVHNQDSNFLNDTNSDDVAYRKSHSPRFDINENIYANLFNFFKYFFYEILLISILLIFRRDNTSKINNFLYSLIISMIFINIIYYLNLYFNIFDSFALVNKEIPNLLNRMLITRFLNINNIFVLVFTFSYFLLKTKNKKLIFPKIYLTSYFFLHSIILIFFSNIIIEHIPIIKFQKIAMNFLIYLNFPVAVLYHLFVDRIEKISQKLIIKINIQRLFTISIMTYLIIIFLYVFPLKYFTFYDFKSSNKLLFQNINNYNYNEIIIGPLIYGYIDPSFLSNSSILLPMHTIRSFKNYKLVDVWCFEDHEGFDTTKNYFEFVEKDCLEKKSLNDWKIIADNLNIKYVLTRSKVNLRINLIGSNDFIKLYEIKD